MKKREVDGRGVEKWEVDSREMERGRGLFSPGVRQKHSGPKSMKPLIGVTSTKILLNSPYYGAYVAEGYFTGIAQAGGIPLIIPLVEEADVWRDIIEHVDGLIFTGGLDIHPQFYGEGLHPQIGELYPLRDRQEIAAARYALEIDKPVVGICRGCQILNVAKGGSLYQDINSQCQGTYLHTQTAPRDEGSHYVEIGEDSRLYEAFGVRSLFTNSFHHQAIKELAAGFRKVAQAKDGVIEGFESMEHTFVMGIQFHPEMMWHSHTEMFRLARYFVDYCGKRQTGTSPARK
ncbi:putative glutamine amidotransferasec [Peptococcaceae bacterium CEB3]|nr:putative glutamine amidotransferasec [Peptococcaceae bacterium CEB3]